MQQLEANRRLHTLSRHVLLGRDGTWATRLATGPRAIYVLATFALLMHVLDLATGLHMMLAYGISIEQNPLARYVMLNVGPLGLAAVKLCVVLTGIFLFVRTAHLGRPRLARNCLLSAAALGMLGWASNQVG